MGVAPRRALTLRRLVACLALVAPVLLGAAPAGRTPPVAVYGVELDVMGERERVLVFAEQPLEGRLEELDPQTLLVVIPGAVLAPSAPARVAGSPAGGVRLVTAEETAGAAGPEVRLRIARTPGPPAELTRRGATLAIELARPRRPREQGIAVKFENADLFDVVAKLAPATGERFIYDDSLEGVVTVTSPELVSPEEALELLHTVLLMKGFVALPTPSGARKIMKLETGLGAAPWTLAAPGEGSDAPIATLVRLRSASAEQVATSLKPWVGGTALAIAHAPTNALIIAGSEARLRELLTLVSAIDQASDADLHVRRLRHRSAGDAAELLLAALGRSRGERAGVEVWPDERTGALVLRATPERMAAARAFLEEIDRPPEGRGRVSVIELRYADPEAMSALLGNLATGTTSRSAGAAAEASVPGGELLAGRDYSVAVFAPTSSLVVRGEPETLALLEGIVDQLDRAPVTIAVEVIVLQVIYDSELDLGFDAFIPLTTPKSPNDLIASLVLDPTGGGLFQPGAGTGPAYAARFTRAPLVLPFVDSDGNPASLIVPRTSAVLTANDARVNTTQLMRPHLRMLAGEEQEIFAGNNIPVPVSQASIDPNLPFRTSQNVERQDVGIRLRVKPSVGEAGGVRLELDVDATALAPPLGGNVDAVGPTIRQRRLTSTIHLDDGEFAVVGFAREELFENDETGVPWFREIPILGWAFRADSSKSISARLVIAAQARLERSPEEQVEDSIRQRLAFERSNARLEHVPIGAETTWALRVATLGDAAEAEAVAARVGKDTRPARVSRWESSGGPAFDVTVFGFATLSEANAAALEFREDGWVPDLVVVPVEAREP